MNSKLWEQRIGKHGNQKLNFGRGLKADEKYRPRRFMILEEVRKIWGTTSMQSFEGQSGQFKPYCTRYKHKPPSLTLRPTPHVVPHLKATNSELDHMAAIYNS